MSSENYTCKVSNSNCILAVNSFGILLSKSLTLHLFDHQRKINLKKIDRIFIQKKRVFTVNYIFFSTSILTSFSFYFVNYNVGHLSKFIMSSIVLLQLLGCIFLRINKYNLVVELKNKEPIRIGFPLCLCKEAAMIMRKVNRYIKEHENDVPKVAFQMTEQPVISRNNETMTAC